jgi:hypothetical protein
MINLFSSDGRELRRGVVLLKIMGIQNPPRKTRGVRGVMNTNARAAVTPAKAGVYEEAHDPKTSHYKT